ncbi:hypothetical protein [Halalkalicoccus sp. NIPERK01]|uniref:hypothetical protein n=1 Tax=Halalkalicoccus sp. NIPERK01 TaxID=3053469 RepID=UPI00256EC68C|nr:hypothetical protein [Halalkalicoccus sp. NIPERK01]MDL5362414.1 hypothetical protein [Halalkalicoccus sp. NIPERK01]
MKRRQVLGGVVGMAALAGCLGSARETYPWPVIDDDALEGWGRLSERSDEYEVSYRGIDALSVHERTYTYDYTALRESIAEFSRGEVDRSLARFVASRMTLEGIGRRFATPERLVDDAMRGVESGFRARGIEAVERVDPADPLPAMDGEIVEYRGLTPLPPFSREVSAHGVSTTVEFSGQPLDMEGVFAVWKPAVDTAYVAGGVFPPEDALETLVPGVSGVSLASVLDLGFDPSTLREQVVGLVEATG